MGKLQEFNFYHDKFTGMTLSLNDSRVKAVRVGYSEIARGHRKPAESEKAINVGTDRGAGVVRHGMGVGGRSVWVGLTLSYLLMLRISRLFAVDEREFHEVYCVRSSEVASHRGDHQLSGARKEEAEDKAVRFRARRGTKVGRVQCWWK